MAKKSKSRKGKMPPALKAYWAKKRGGGKKRSKVAKRASPKRRGRTTKKAKRAHESRNASHEVTEIMRAASDKLRKLSWGFSGRAGRRK